MTPVPRGPDAAPRPAGASTFSVALIAYHPLRIAQETWYAPDAAVLYDAVGACCIRVPLAYRLASRDGAFPDRVTWRLQDATLTAFPCPIDQPYWTDDRLLLELGPQAVALDLSAIDPACQPAPLWERGDFAHRTLTCPLCPAPCYDRQRPCDHMRYCCACRIWYCWVLHVAACPHSQHLSARP